jgi:hypothetical protein
VATQICRERRVYLLKDVGSRAQNIKKKKMFSGRTNSLNVNNTILKRKHNVEKKKMQENILNSCFKITSFENVKSINIKKKLIA